MGGLLAEVVERMERETFFATAREQLERLHTSDPEEWARYRAESNAWQHATDGDSATVRGEADQWE